MSEPRDKPPPDDAGEDNVLGRLPEGERDSGLRVGPQVPSVSHSKPTSAERVPPPAPDEAELIALPRGALVIMRQSGGLRFRTREVVVYRDGRVRHDSAPRSRRARGEPEQRLNEQELAELNMLLQQIFVRKKLPPTTATQSPDAYAYEIATRPRLRLYRTEAFTGSIPEPLLPLIERLQRLMRSEDIQE